MELKGRPYWGGGPASRVVPLKRFNWQPLLRLCTPFANLAAHRSFGSGLWAFVKHCQRIKITELDVRCLANF